MDAQGAGSLDPGGRPLKAKYPTAMYLVVGTAAPGSESHLQRFTALAAELGVADNVVFTGDLPDPRPVYAAVDVSVVPSVDPEPFGCVVIESMALETPVVGSGSAGIAEQIVHGETGLLFPPGDDRALAASLDLLFAEAAHQKSDGQRGRQRYLSTFEMEHSYREHIKVFDAVRRRTPRHDSSEEPPRNEGPAGLSCVLPRARIRAGLQLELGDAPLARARHLGAGAS